MEPDLHHELNWIYVPTEILSRSSPTPSHRRESVTASFVALNADTGKMAWYFQSSPHDKHDWDATQTSVLFDDVVNGQPRKACSPRPPQRQVFVLDRVQAGDRVDRVHQPTGRWAPTSAGADPEPRKRPQSRGRAVTPNQAGATTGIRRRSAPRRVFYVNANRAFSVWYIYDPSDIRWAGENRSRRYSEQATQSIDYKDGRDRWSIRGTAAIPAC